MTTDRHSREEQRGVARGREERGGGADRGAQDNGRASDNPVLVVVGGHTNKSLSQYPFVLPFFETRQVEPSRVEKLLLLLLLLMLLLLQTHHLF